MGDVGTFIARFSASEEQIPSEPFLESLIEFKKRGYILYYFIPDFESEDGDMLSPRGTVHSFTGIRTEKGQ